MSRPALPQALTQALNVDPASNFFSGDNGVGFNYTLTERSVFRVFDAAIAKGFKVLVYNGDTDPGVNMVAIQDIAAAFAQEYATTPFFQCIFVTFEQAYANVTKTCRLTLATTKTGSVRRWRLQSPVPKQNQQV